MTTTAAKTASEAAIAAVLAYRAVLTGDDADELLLNDVEREVAKLRGQLDDAIDDMRDEYGVGAARAVTDLVVLGDRLQTLAERVAAKLKSLVSYTPTHTTSAGLIAFELYQDITRSLEVIRLNPEKISNPNRIPQGTELQVYDR